MSTVGDHVSTPADTVVDRENPWPGLHAYDERGKDYFKGRHDVARDLLRLIVREDLVLLYGISGLGKTSLLRAGVFPDLPPNFLPVYLRLAFVPAGAAGGRDGHRPLTSSDLVAQVVAATQEAARQRNVEPPARPPVAGRGLWEYFRRADDGFWGPGGLLMTPVLVFDQFEELFTRVESPAAARRRFDEFLHDLANLQSGREPPWYESACATDEDMARPAYTRQAGVCKIVLCFREDYLANVKGLSRVIPSIDRIFLRLEPMTRKAAARAICEAGRHLIEGHGDKETLRTSIRIIRKVTGAPGRLADTSTVDPALLSLFCRELNERRKAVPGALIDRQLVDSAEASQILTTFYAEAMRDVLPVTRRFVEDTLVLPGTRSRWPAAEPMAFAAGVPAADLEALTRKRILRRDVAAGVARFELTHDVLVDVVLESRAHRLDQEKIAQERQTHEARSEETRRALEREIAHAERQRKRAVRNGLMAGAAAVLLLVTVLALVGILRLEHEQRARNWAEAAYTEAPGDASLSAVLGLRALDESDRARASMPLALLGLNNAVRVPHLQQRMALQETPLNIAISADGVHVALLSGSSRLVELWNVSAVAAAPIARLALTDDVFSMAFDRGGSELVIVYRSTAIDRVDVNTTPLRLEHFAPAIGVDRIVSAAAVSPDGQRLLVASDAVWTTVERSGEPQWLSVFDRRAGTWQPAIVAPKDASFVLGAHASAYATLGSGRLSFAPSSGESTSLTIGQTGLVGLDPDGTRLFTVRRDGDVLSLLVVSLPQGTSWRATLPSAADAVTGMFSGDRLALTQADGRASVWDLAAQRRLFEVDGAQHLAWSHDGNRLLTWGLGNSVDVRDAFTGRLIERISGHDDPVSAAVTVRSGGVVVTIAGQRLYVWQRPDVDRVLPTGSRPTTLSFNAAGDKVIAASGRSVHVYDAQFSSTAPSQLTALASLALPAPVTALAIAPDGNHLAIGTEQGEILLRTLQDTDASSATLPVAGAVSAVAFGASDRQLAWAAQSTPMTTSIVLRHLDTNGDVVSKTIHGDVVAIAVDGERVAVGLAPDHDIESNDYSTDSSESEAEHRAARARARTRVALVASLPPAPESPAARAGTQPSIAPSPEPRPVNDRCDKGSASLSRNLRFAATVNSCATVTQWRDLHESQPLEVDRPVARVTVSTDGNLLALAFVDGAITLHHTSLPARASTIAGPGGNITALTFDAKATRLAAARADGSVTIYPISGPQLLQAARTLAGTRQPTPDECQRLFGTTDQCDDIDAWRLVTRRIIHALRGR